MTVAMYRSQQHGWRGQRIDTRKPESGIMLTWHMGEIKLLAFSLGRRICFRLLSLLVESQVSLSSC